MCVGAALSQRKRTGLPALPLGQRLAGHPPGTDLCARYSESHHALCPANVNTLSPHGMHASRGHECSVMRVVILQQHGLQK